MTNKGTQKDKENEEEEEEDEKKKENSADDLVGEQRKEEKEARTTAEVGVNMPSIRRAEGPIRPHYLNLFLIGEAGTDKSAFVQHFLAVWVFQAV